MEWKSIIWWIALIVVLIILFYIAYSLPVTCFNYVCSNLGISKSKLIWGGLGVLLLFSLLIVLTQVPTEYRDQFMSYLESENKNSSSSEHLVQPAVNSVIETNFEHSGNFDDLSVSDSDISVEQFAVTSPSFIPRSYNSRFDFSKAIKPYSVRVKKSRKEPSSGELACKKAAEKIFGRPFEKVEISWLKNNKTKRFLELDCYNDDLKIGIEYQGEQHYQPEHFFHRKSKASYKRSVDRDIL
jgi:hypothetical protein